MSKQERNQVPNCGTFLTDSGTGFKNLNTDLTEPADGFKISGPDLSGTGTKFTKLD